MSGSSTDDSQPLTIEKLKKKEVPMVIKLYLISRNENLQALIGNMLFIQKTLRDEALQPYKIKMMRLIYADLIRGAIEPTFLGLAATTRSTSMWATRSVDIKEVFNNYYKEINT